MRFSDWRSDVCSSDREAQRISDLKNRLLECIRGRLSGVALNGHAVQRIAGNLNLAFEGVDAEALMRALPRLAVSSGSACTSTAVEPSYVLRRSEEHTSELQSLMSISYAVFCLKKNKQHSHFN